MERHERTTHRFFSPSGISSNSLSSKCCSETVHACLYVSGFIFVFAWVVESIFGRGWKEGDDTRRARFPNFIGGRVSVIGVDAVGGGGFIETSSPVFAIPSDRLLFVGVESTNSPLANFVDGPCASLSPPASVMPISDAVPPGILIPEPRPKPTPKTGSKILTRASLTKRWSGESGDR